MRLRPVMLRSAVVLLAGAAAASTVADTITVGADLDNTLIEGPGQEMSLGAAYQFYVGRTGPNAGNTVRRGLIRFPVSGIPAGSTITSVQVSLYMSKGSGGAATIAFKKCLASWGEGLSFAFGGGGAPAEPGDATWTKRLYPGTPWTTPGGDFVATASVTKSVNAVTWYVFGSTAGLVADVQSWVNAPGTNYGWVVTGNEVTLNSAKRFESHQTTAVSWKPSMTVVFTPPPPCAPEDLNCDGSVDGDDLGTLLGQWGPCPGCVADLDHDGKVDGDDLGTLLGAWG